jgi:predicted nucleotidyltransferase
MTPETRTILTELQEFELLYGERLLKLLLFGSQACGDAEDGSDIGVLVVLRGHVYPGTEIDRTVNVSHINRILGSCERARVPGELKKQIAQTHRVQLY